MKRSMSVIVETIPPDAQAPEGLISSLVSNGGASADTS